MVGLCGTKSEASIPKNILYVLFKRKMRYRKNYEKMETLIPGESC
jgi:hypothetical protein